MNEKDKEINRLALMMAKMPPKKLAKELNKLPLDKLLKVHKILKEHLTILEKEKREAERN